MLKGAAIAVVVLIALGGGDASSSQPHHYRYAQNTKQPDAERSEASQPQAEPVVTTQPKPDSGSKHKEECHYGGPKWFAGFYCFFAAHEKFWVAFGTLLLAVVTATLFAATALLYRATKGLVASAEQTAERQLRAYISILQGDFDGPAEDGGLRFAVKIRNAGQTPALDVVNWIGTGIAAYPRQGPFQPPPTRDIHKTAIGPGCDVLLWITKRSPPSEEELAAINAGTKALYVYGRLEYQDAFGHPQWTNFAFTYPGGGIAGLRRYKEHNDAS